MTVWLLVWVACGLVQFLAIDVRRILTAYESNSELRELGRFNHFIGSSAVLLIDLVGGPLWLALEALRWLATPSGKR